jgi:hypothetical protein
VIVYASVNAAIVAFWAVLAIGGWSDLVKISVLPNQGPLPAGFFWPIFPIVIWGALLLLSARGAYGAHNDTEGNVAEETKTKVARAAINPMQPSNPAAEQTRLRNGFYVHIVVYVVINSLLTLAWTRTGGFFWPVFLMVFWGIGVAINAYIAFRPRAASVKE